MIRILDFLQERSPIVRDLIVRIAPLGSLYRGLSAREQLLIKLGFGLVILWLAYSLVYEPYMSFRQEILLTHQQMLEDYEWLESQQERLTLLLNRRGVRRDALNDVEKLIGQYMKGQKIDYRPDNVIDVSWRGDAPRDFLKAINSLINQGATLQSFEFQRQGDSAQVDFKARVKI